MLFKERTVSHLFLPLLSPAAAAAKSLQSCPTLCNPRDGSPIKTGVKITNKYRCKEGGKSPQSSAFQISLVQFSSVAQSCLTLRDPVNHSTPGLPVHQQLLESTQTHVHLVGGHLILCRPLLLLPSIYPSIRVFSNKSALRIRWPAKVLKFHLQQQSYQ